MACLHCHVHKSCLPDLHQICSVTTVFWTGSRRDVSELCNHQERSSLPTDFTGLYLQCQLGSLFGLECYDWLWLVMNHGSLWLVRTMNELRTSSCCAVEVESFARKAPITETNLDRLERRIQSRAQGKAWESRSESRKVEKSFDKSASYTFTKVFKDIQRQLAQTVDGASTVSKAISGISRLGKLGSSGKVMPTCKARKGDVSDVNQSEFWLFHACSAFPNCSQSWHFSMFVSKQRPDVSQHFREHQLVKLVESLPTFLFFFEFSFLCAQIVTGWFGSSKILVEAVHWLESKEQEFPGKRERATQSVKKRLTQYQYHKYTCCSPLGCFQHVFEATVTCEQVNVWAPKVQHLWLENNS